MSAALSMSFLRAGYVSCDGENVYWQAKLTHGKNVALRSLLLCAWAAVVPEGDTFGGDN